MTDARALLSTIARLTKERDDYADLCRDFSGAESPEALIAALRDRGRMEAEIARLGEYHATMREDYENCCASVGVTSIMEMVDLIASLKADLAAAEEVARKAVQAIPIAMDAAAEKEREALALSGEHVTDVMVEAAIDELREVIDGDIAERIYDLLVDCVRASIAAAIRARREGRDHA